MFYYKKIIDENNFSLYASSRPPFKTNGLIEITEEEYNEAMAALAKVAEEQEE